MLDGKEVFSIVNGAVAKAKRNRAEATYERVKAFALGDPEKMFSYMPMNPRESNAEFLSKPKGVSLVAKDVLQRYLNGVSALPISRVLKSGSDFDFSFYAKNLNLSKIQMLTEIAGTVLVRPVVSSDGEVDYEIYLPHEFTPIVNSKTGKLNELILHYGETIEHWTRNTLRMWEKGELQVNSQNPYNRIPFAVYRAGQRAEEFWGQSSLDPVAFENNKLNLSVTNLLTLSQEQSFSLWTLLGFDNTAIEDDGRNEANPHGNPIRLDPSGIVTLPPGVELKPVTPSASINELVNYINSELNRIRREAGVVDVDDSQYSSGFALRVRKGTYLELMAAKRSLFEKSDANLMELAVLVFEVAKTGQERFLNPEFSVESHFDASSLTPKSSDELREQVERDRFQLEINAITPVEIIARDRKVSLEEAETIYRRNLTNNSLSLVPQEESKE